jgi:alpha-L-fucosidase 2
METVMQETRLGWVMVVGVVVCCCCFMAWGTGARAQEAKPGRASVNGATAGQDEQDLRLWYTKPAAKWVEALAIGNGRLGGMIHGGVEEELINLNDNTLYSGWPGQRDIKLDIQKDLDKVVGMLKERRYAEADDFVMKNWLGRPQYCYQPLGDLKLTFGGGGTPGNASDYRRELDLTQAIARTTYTVAGVQYTREYFASHPGGCLVVRVSADKPGAVNVGVGMASVHPTAKFSVDGTDTVVMRGQVPGNVVRRDLKWIADRGEQWKYPELFDKEGRPLPGAKQVTYDGKGMRFETRVKAVADGGKVSAAADGHVKVEGANAVTFILTSGSSYNGFDKHPVDQGKDESAEAKENLARAGAKSFEQLRDEHVKDYKSLFDRVTIDLGAGGDKSDLPTEKRVELYAKGGDEGMAALYYQFGRYLLIAGSRAGGQPLNLQGMWSTEVIPPWASAYTVNINTEMNYWPAEMTNLSECHEPLFQMLRELQVTGTKVAKDLYQRPGWVLHHNTTIWRDAQPVEGNPKACLWPMAGGWLSEHLFDHYLFTGDEQFLRDTAYPIMKGAAEFLGAWLVDDGSGHLVTPVGVSPENVFLYTDKDGQQKQGQTSMGPTMDMAIVRELFTNTVRASEILGTDESFRTELKGKLEKLAPFKIGKGGRLQEWQEDFMDQDPRHRHVSHLYGLHPSNQISPLTTPELADAAKKTLELRGDKATGWSLGWKINLWARLRDGDHAHKLIGDLLTLVGGSGSEMNMKGGGTYPNLFDAHPPFQIDGNFGGTAGMTEMVLQSQNGEIDLLPALPKAWPSGSVKGLRARGGYGVDVTWKDGKLAEVALTSSLGRSAKVRYGEKVIEVSPGKGERVVLDGNLARK